MYARFNTGSGRQVVDRAEAHTMRLAMLYALLDGSKVIEASIWRPPMRSGNIAKPAPCASSRQKS